MNEQDIFNSFLLPSLLEQGILLDNTSFKETKYMTLYGNDSGMDSIALVTFIISVEEKLRASGFSHISLSSEKAFSVENSPFNTIQALVGFISCSIEETKL
ncbi:MAG: hypothetical protein OEY33_07870 [Bdellovibrionales bacterium]|nr:hypothetical protein [Bdellovibrionales bacterium]